MDRKKKGNGYGFVFTGHAHRCLNQSIRGPCHFRAWCTMFAARTWLGYTTFSLSLSLSLDHLAYYSRRTLVYTAIIDTSLLTAQPKDGLSLFRVSY
jgi:hypothetical protein